MSHRIYKLIYLLVLIAVAIAILQGCSVVPQSKVSWDRASAVPGHVEVSPYRVPLTTVPVISNAKIADMYFRYYGVNPTIDTREQNTSTFSIDVDTASYSLVRGYLQRGVLPQPAAIRVEEFVNAFDYRYRGPRNDAFNLHAEAFPSPNRRGYHILHIGLQGKRLSRWQRKPANLVFVLDVSSSMAGPRRIGLLKRSMNTLLRNLRHDDRVSIVTFNQRAQILLRPTLVRDRHYIMQVIAGLQAYGSTNVDHGLKLGYQIANGQYRRNSINRIILVSDGVANTGLTTASDIFATIQKSATRGIQLNTVGIGMGNYNDVLLETLAKKGQGMYGYINDMNDARRMFVRQLTGSLQLLARDVKIQVEFDPRRVARYRLLGYENRLMSKRDFRNDNKDAGEVGYGHAVTAIYEIRLRRRAGRHYARGYFGALRVRYKKPRQEEIREIGKRLPFSIVKSRYHRVSSWTRLSFVAAAFAEKLRQSYWARNLNYQSLLDMHSRLSPRVRAIPQVAELGQLISTAMQLDRREDKFAGRVPVNRMTFDHVPVLQ